MPPASDEGTTARPAPGSTASLRAANQRRVVRVLQQLPAGGTLSQAEIARSTHLAPATVSNIVRDLAAAGMLAQTALNSDLLVMGCYGHSRFREVLMGGATRSVLRIGLAAFLFD